MQDGRTQDSSTQENTHETFAIAGMPAADGYKLLTSLVMPRPIAWVLTESADGKRNAAPYSFFNLLSTNPPIVALGFGAPTDRNSKDTLANLRATGDMVVHLVSEDLAEAMNVTAVDAPRGVDETLLAGLELLPSVDVRPPRIARAKAALECRLRQEIDLGTGNTIALATVLQAHVAAEVFEDRSRLHIDTAKLALIGRMTGGEGGYCTTRDTFSLKRPTWATLNRE